MVIDIFVKTIIALCGLANLLLAFYVYRKNTKDRLNINFFYFGSMTSLWCFVNFASMMLHDLFWLRSTYAISCSLALTGVLFTYALADKQINKWFKIFLYSLTAFFFISSFTPLSVESIMSYTGFGLEIITGPLFIPWEIFFTAMVLIIVYIPLSVLKKVDEQRKRQITYFLAGESIFAFWGIFVTIVLPALGIHSFINLDSPSTLFLIGFTSYAIIKYHLLGISSLFFQAFIYALVIVSIIVSLLLLMFGGSYLFAHEMMWPLYVIVVVVAIVLFFIGRLFFNEKRDLENAKINLTDLLSQSEKNRMIAETERDKTVTIIDSFSDGLIILDEKDEIFSINPEAAKIMGLYVKNLLNKPFKSLENFPKAAPVLSALNMGLTNFSRREITLAKDLIIELSVIPLNLSEKDIGHLIVIHDISREKIVEEMKTEFVSLAAHQLRTPLTAINWSMGMLKNGEYGKLNKEQSDVIDGTIKNDKRLIALVNNLLNITRIEEGKYISKTTLTDVKEIVASVIETYKIEAEKRNIKIEYMAPKTSPQVMADAEKIRIAVQNIIDNAVKYSYEGGIILVTLKSDSRNVIFKVQDYGIGIPKNQQDKVFTKFFRGDNAVKVEANNGTGLGLFMTDNIIKAHGGKIKFESEEGVGTTFYFNLPR